MKILVLGDIHGRPIWKSIYDKENPDLTIFLGDFVSSHESYTDEDQIRELKEIMDLKRTHPDRIILLRGNHDLDGLGYPWAFCYPAIDQAKVVMSQPEFRDEFLRLTQWMWVANIADRPTIFSHAGVSECWLKEILKMDGFDPEVINALPPGPEFGFCGDRWDSYGTSPQQSCTWIRPPVLLDNRLKGYDQVVGHTNYGEVVKPMGMPDSDKIWLCDTLKYGAYLVIENDEFIPKNI